MNLLDTKTLDILVAGKYPTSYRLREVFLNIYNDRHFQHVELLSILRGSDEEHLKLFYDILQLAIDDLTTFNELGQYIIMELEREKTK